MTAALSSTASDYWLVQNPPSRRQYYTSRVEKPSGVVVLHSTESVADVNPPDSGAENVANFIRTRDEAGSYHELVDSDSIMDLIPPWYTAFHVGTYQMNRHAFGVSGAFQASKFRSLGQYQDPMIRNMAIAAARYALWIKATHGIEIPARRLTLAEAQDKKPGFITHGQLDPGRRSDPDYSTNGSNWDWDKFFRYYNEALGATTGDDDDMSAYKSAEEARPFVENAYKRIAGRAVESEKTRETWVYVCVVDPKGANDLMTALHNERRIREDNRMAAIEQRIAEQEGRTYDGPAPMTEQQILETVAKALQNG